MKIFMLIALLSCIGYAGWDKINALVSGGPEPLRESSYVVVYGRDTCGRTKSLLKGLDRSGVPYEYKRVNDSAVADELHPRMAAAGLDTGYYLLPVVDVNADITIRPDADAVATKYRHFDVAKSRTPDRGNTSSDAIAATQHLADPLVKCTVGGQETYMFQSQCPQ